MNHADISIWQFLVGLLCGGTVFIYPDEIALHPKTLLEQVQRDRITVLEVVPTLLRALLEELEKSEHLPLPHLRWLIPTGEALPPDLCNRWLARYPDIPLLNAYGPTECSDDVTHHIIRTPLPAAALRTPIGRPIANMQAYILDQEKRVCPVGIVGELWIGGVGVGPGYLNDPEQTSVAFHPDPFRPDTDARLYRTGDLARYRNGGAIEFFGRQDTQVKIRGARVELEEIEAVLRAHLEIEDCAVLFPKDLPEGGPHLFAFAVAIAGRHPTAELLRAHMRRHLPEHMTPTRIYLLDALPLTPNGKVDRLGLVQSIQAIGNPAEIVREMPRNGLEERLIRLWQRVLKRERIGVQDNFFELGGDSIRAAIVVNDLQNHLNEIVYVVAIFDAPTIEQLAEYLSQQYVKGVARWLGTEMVAATVPSTAVDARHLTEFRSLIPSVNVLRNRQQERNRQAIFVLSAPRSGSTLFRVMLAGHPALFAPPELDLLGFADMAQRRDELAGRWSFRREGLLRGVMELYGCDAEEAKAIVGEAEEGGMPVSEFYGQLQRWLGPLRRLVDKTPIYALDSATLRRIENEFEEPLYIHLLRHPLGMINSFVQARTDQVFLRQTHSYPARTLAELVWTVSHQNILNFLKDVPPQRQCRIHFEQLVTSPSVVIQKVCELLQIDLHPAMLDPYTESTGRMTDGLYPVSRMLGDVRFLSHGRIDPTVAERWRDALPDHTLGSVTRDLAESLGYEDNVDEQTADNRTHTVAPLGIRRLDRAAYRVS